MDAYWKMNYNIYKNAKFEYGKMNEQFYKVILYSKNKIVEFVLGEKDVNLIARIKKLKEQLENFVYEATNIIKEK
jgi:hypothetical protein